MRYGGKGPLPRRFCARCLEVADCYRSLLVAIVLVLVVYRIRSISVSRIRREAVVVAVAVAELAKRHLGVNDTR